MSEVMATVAPAQMFNLVLFTNTGTSSLTGMTLITTLAGTLVLVLVLATKVNSSLTVFSPLW